MKIGFDFDGTITKNPFLFRILINSLIASGNEIYIISGTAEKDRLILTNELKSFGIINVPNSNIILKYEYGDVADTTNWKFNIIDKYKIRCYFDNRPETIKKLNMLCTTFLIK